MVLAGPSWEYLGVLLYATLSLPRGGFCSAHTAPGNSTAMPRDDSGILPGLLVRSVEVWRRMLLSFDGLGWKSGLWAPWRVMSSTTSQIFASALPRKPLFVPSRSIQTLLHTKAYTRPSKSLTRNRQSTTLSPGERRDSRERDRAPRYSGAYQVCCALGPRRFL